MSQTLSEGSNIRIEVFTDLDEARRWLLDDAGNHKADRVLPQNKLEMNEPDNQFNKVHFVLFCEAAHANTRAQGRITFLKNLSEYLSRDFDLPLYLPGDGSNEAMVEDFYKNDIGVIVKNISTESFDVEEIIDSYLERQ